MAVPTYEDILSFYDALPDDDKTPTGFAPRTLGRQEFCEWFLETTSAESGGFYETKAGITKAGHTPLRIRGLYLLEKALNRRARETKKAGKLIGNFQVADGA